MSVLKCIALNVTFLRQCLDCGVCPNAIQKRVQKAKAHQSLAIEKTFITDDIARSTDTLGKVRSQFRRLYRQARAFLSEHDFLRFSMLNSENSSGRRDMEATCAAMMMNPVVSCWESR